ncbi:MAG: glycosyltransferase family 4 protein [Pseudoxanthomonas sp.]
MSELQRVGNGETAPELRGRLMTALPMWMLLHFVLAAVGTGLARRYALTRQMVDQPGERRSHGVATPRGGGIAIVGVVLAGIIWLAVNDSANAVTLGCFAAGLLLVAAVGWMDDHRPMPAWPRLLVHALASLLLAWGVHWSSPGLIGPVVAFVLAMALVNVWNFMDGIDGLAGSQALIVALSVALILAGGAWGWIAAGLAAAVAGFLPFNFPKAHIFLGDVGSGALGFLLAGLLVAAFQADRTSWPLLLLPISAFLVDASFTLGMRMLRRERWWTPHVQHTYQKWASRRGSHGGVTVAYAGFSLLAVFMGLLAMRWADYWSVGISLVWFAGAGSLWMYMRRDVSDE